MINQPVMRGFATVWRLPLADTAPAACERIRNAHRAVDLDLVNRRVNRTS
jgi:hypothetical protein